MIPQARIRLIAYAIVLTFLGGVIAVAVPRGGNDQIHVTALFSKAIGLFKDSHVRVLGVDVGRVTSVKPEGQQVKVTMTIEKTRKIPADAHAVIVPISLIADRYIQLTPVYESGPALHDGSVIGVDHTAIPAELDDLLAQLKKLLDAVQSGKPGTPASIGAAIFNLAAALKGTGNDLSQTLSGGGALAGAAADNAAAIESSVVDLANLLAALTARRNDIIQLNTRLASALGAIAEEHDTLGSALGNIGTLTQELGSLIAAHRTDLESDLSVLAKTTSVLNNHQASLAQGLDWLPVLTDGGESEHTPGAVHQSDGGPFHVDVRDSHAFSCAPGLTSAVCLLLGLTTAGGVGLPGLSLPLPGAAGSSATPGAAVTPGAASDVPPVAPAPPDPTNLLDLLPRLPLGPRASTADPTPQSTPGIRGFFDGIGGLVDHAFRWLFI